MKLSLSGLLLAPLVVLLAGCSSTHTSNFTPRSIPLTPTRTYPFEAEWDSIRRGVDPSKVQAWVMVDNQLYPMNRVPVAPKRWEAQVPVVEGRTYVPYKFRFDYEYPGLGKKLTNSIWSAEYRLVIPQK